MKKILLLTFVFVALYGLNETQAQSRSTGNASDHTVALPTPPPQLSPTVGTNAVNSPVSSVPQAPPVQTLPGTVVNIVPGVTTSGVLPSVPSAPIPPPVPAVGTPPPVSNFSTTLNLPSVPVLPPVPPIPAMPDIRLPAMRN